jgi:hypothetical protein
MKPSLAKRLQKLEQDADARRAIAEPPPFDGAAFIREALQAWGIEQQPDESLMMALARGMGIRPIELRDRLRMLACA